MAARLLSRLRKLIARSRPSVPGPRRAPRTLRLEQLEERAVPATLLSDKPDYAPGETAIFTGSGFQPGETIVMQVLHTDVTHNTGPGHVPFVVTDGGAGDLDGVANGSFLATYFVDPGDSAGETFRVTAVGLSSGESVSAIFTDGGARLGAYGNVIEEYRNGALNLDHAAYTEGSVVPFRYAYSDGVEGALVTIDISYQYQKVTGSATYNTFDFLASDNVTVPMQDADRRFDPNALPSDWGLTPANVFTDTTAIPDDPSITLDDDFPGAREFLVLSNFANTEIVSVQHLGVDPRPATQGEHKLIRLVLRLGDDGDGIAGEPVVDYGVYWGGHLARDVDYPGENNGAASAPGKSYKMDVFATQTAGGNIPSQSANLDAVIDTSLSWEKRDTAGTLQGGATFTLTPNPFSTGTLTVVDNGAFDGNPVAGQITVLNVPFGTYTLTETVPPPGYLLDPNPTRVQAVSPANPHAVVGVMGQDDPGSTNESDFHNQGPEAPGLAVNKAFTGVTGGDGDALPDAPGDVLNYTITVTNTGNVTLTNVTVTDPLTGLSQTIASLAPDETQVFNASYTLTQDDLDGAGNAGPDGDIDNTVTADSDQTDPTGDTETVPLVITPAITLDKEFAGVTGGNGDGIVNAVGDVLNYTFAVTNTGNVTLFNVTLADLGVTVSGGPIAVLAPGASNSTTFTATYTITQTDIDAGFKINTAVVIGFTFLEEEVTDDDSAAVSVLPPPPPVVVAGRIVVEKVANPVGNPHVFKFSSSFGNFALAGGQNFTSQSLVPGTYSVSELIPAGWNLAAITITDPSGNSVVLGENTALVTLDPGEVVTVRFTNFAVVIPPDLIGKVELLGNQSVAGAAGELMQQAFFVNDLYHDVLGRVPSPGEVNGRVQQLQAGVSREQVVNGFWLSAEHLAALVEQYYQQILHRSADSSGLATWVAAMQNGLTEGGLMVALLTSAEYAAAHPDDASFITGLYADVLGRTLGDAELQDRLAAVQQFGRAAVAAGVVNSAEAFARLLVGYYQDYLHRTPSDAEIQGWVASLNAGFVTRDTLPQYIFGSMEYFMNAP